MTKHHPLTALITQRLADSMLQVPHPPQQFLDLLAAQQEQDFLDRLLIFAKNQAHIDDKTMEVLFGLRDADNTMASLTQLARCNFYIRSLAMTVRKLTAVLDEYDSKYSDGTFVEDWRNELRECDADDTVWLRYVGMTSRTAEKRAEEDDSNKSLKSRLKNFMDTAKALFPHTSDQVKVYYMTPLGIHTPPSDERTQLADSTEQFAIHLFDRKLLLNSQPGGYYRSYKPRDDDLEVIRRFDLGAISRPPMSNATCVALTDRIMDIYKRECPGFANGAHFFVRAMTVRQAIGQYGLHAPMMSPLTILGSDITVHDMKTAQPYFHGSRAGNLCKSLLKSVQGTNGDDVHLFGFVDVYPTRDRGHLAEDILALAHVLQVLQPIVLPCLGELPVSVALSNFHGVHGMTDAGYAESLGKPFLTNIDADFDYAAPIGQDARDMWCIAVPGHDHGFVSYGPGSPDTMRFMLLVWTRVVLLEKCAVNVLASPDHPPLMSKALCKRVLALWQEKERESDLAERIDSAFTKFHDAFVKSKKDRAAKMEKKAIDADDLARFSTLGKMGVAKRVKALGHALGDKDSTERRQQAETLWRYGFPELRSLHADKNALVNWLMSLEQGRDIFRCALQAHQAAKFDDRDDYTAKQLNALSRCGPLIGLEKGDHSFLDDPELVKAAASAKGKQMAAIRKERPSAAPTTVKGMDAIAMFVDAPVRVDSNHRANLRVIGDEGKARAIPNGIQLPKSVPAGEYRLHVDPRIDRRAVLLKQANTNEYVRVTKDRIVKITDEDLMRPGFEGCFCVFKNTLDHLGVPVHESLSETGECRPERVARLFAEKYCVRGTNDFCIDFHTLEKTPTGKRPPRALGRHFATALKELTDTLTLTPSEKLFWTNPKGANLNRIRLALQGFLGGNIDVNKTGGSNSNWKLPEYVLPGESDENDDE